MAPLIIKVCGMTEAENIRNVEQLDVDMIGFIFYPKSPRCLCEIPAYLPVRAKRVGVFVNESKETILMYADRFAPRFNPIIDDFVNLSVGKIQTINPSEE